MKNKIIECLKTLHEVIELDKMKEFLENIQEIIGLKLLQMGQEITSYPHFVDINKMVAHKIFIDYLTVRFCSSTGFDSRCCS